MDDGPRWSPHSHHPRPRPLYHGSKLCQRRGLRLLAVCADSWVQWGGWTGTGQDGREGAWGSSVTRFFFGMSFLLTSSAEAWPRADAPWDWRPPEEVPTIPARPPGGPPGVRGLGGQCSGQVEGSSNSLRPCLCRGPQPPS
ncbi:Hypothetical predicted protein, partial [Marmota monax]